MVATISSVLNFHFLDVDVSTNIDVPNKSTIPTSEWVSSVSKARKSTSQDFPYERSKKTYNTLLPLAIEENNQFGGNDYSLHNQINFTL